MKRVLPDERARKAILEDLDRSMLVEAGAGTGKTTSMVGRLVNLVATGRCEVTTVAAVTFTRKAAAELRGRFQLELERQASARGGVEGDRLRRALGKVEQCFMGTIHSFCGRLLRERPVEAGVDPEFREADEAEDGELQETAWNRYLELVYSGARLGAGALTGAQVVKELEVLGLEPRQLRDTFKTLCGYADVEEWPAPPVPPPDLTTVAAATRNYVKGLRAVVDGSGYQPGTMDEQPYAVMVVDFAASVDWQRLADVMALVEAIAGMERASAGLKLERGDAIKANAPLRDFQAALAAPALEAWYAYRYAAALRLVRPALAVYDAVRREAGVLSFQDLLMGAARLLREGGEGVRRYLRKRFTHLLVDEFQDTDPIQAEVMLLLTASSPKQGDWRKCVPEAGALFVVGDPKQSIYRFRRADIVTYNAVRAIVEKHGRVVRLQANFRTIEPIIDWVNGIFGAPGAWFPKSATAEAPANVPLLLGREAGTAGQLSGVKVLRIPQDTGKTADQQAWEADFVARFIRHALDSGLRLERTPDERAAGVGPEARPADFMLVNRLTRNLATYAEALARYGVPHQVTGGDALNRVPEVRLLHVCARAALEPENPLALAAALRGECFGASDAQLFAFKRAGGAFDYRRPLPQGLAPDDARVLGGAFERLGRYAAWLAELPPVAAVESMAADLGLFARAALAEGANAAVGSLAKTLELLRGRSAEAWSVADLVSHLGELSATGEDQADEPHDAVSALAEDENVVRVMNLHKVKGLEAPVVFLVDPSGKWRDEAELHVDRGRGAVRDYLQVLERRRYKYAQPIIHALPAKWATYGAAEARFLAAEHVRLRYVAATRAGVCLVVTQSPAPKAHSWDVFAAFLEKAPALKDPGPQKAPAPRATPLKANEATQAAADIGAAWAQVKAPTYALRTGRSEVVRTGATGSSPPAPPAAKAGVDALSWGLAVHQALEEALRFPGRDVTAIVRAALEAAQVPAAHETLAADTLRTVMSSALWTRAMASPERYVEVPFTLPDPRGRPMPGVPTVLNGVIDLVFREADGWVIVDWKTDDLSRTTEAHLIAEYGPQLEAYAAGWSEATGGRVKECGIMLTGCGRFVRKV